ncbi:hypothetical protein BS47DRAFT_1367819, partial [Hydnum rufescens UP504]
SWYCIDISLIPEKHDQDPQRCTDIKWVLKLQQWDCLAAHKSKPSHHKGEMLVNAHLWGTKEANELTSVENNGLEQPIQNFMGLVDELLDVGPPPSLWPARLVNYSSTIKGIPLFQSIKQTCSQKDGYRRHLSIWYSAQLASAPPGSITLWMRRLEMMMLSYIDKLDVGGIASHFQEPIRRTGSGTMVADFRPDC